MKTKRSEKADVKTVLHEVLKAIAKRAPVVTLEVPKRIALALVKHGGIRTAATDAHRKWRTMRFVAARTNGAGRNGAARVPGIAAPWKRNSPRPASRGSEPRRSR
jgi:hypothetical protein